MAPLPLLLTLFVAQPNAAPSGRSWRVPCAPEPDTPAWSTHPSGLVVAEPRGGAWHLTVALADGTRRELDTESCEAAARAAHLILRLSGAPSAGTPTTRAAGEPAPTATTTWAVTVGLGGTALQQPTVTPRVAVRGWLERQAVRLSVSMTAGAPSDHAADTRLFRVHPIVAGELSACVVGRLGPVHLGPCGTAAVGAVALHGLDGTGAQGATVGAVFAGLELLLWIPLGAHWLVAAKGGPRIGVVQPEVRGGGATLFRPGILSAELALDVGYRF